VFRIVLGDSLTDRNPGFGSAWCCFVGCQIVAGRNASALVGSCSRWGLRRWAAVPAGLMLLAADDPCMPRECGQCLGRSYSVSMHSCCACWIFVGHVVDGLPLAVSECCNECWS